MKARRIAAITAAGLTVAAGAGAAIAATAGDEGKEAEDAVLEDAAKDLNVRPSELREALSNATAAQLDRELDRAVKDGELTRKQADEIKARHKMSGRVLGFAPAPRGGPGRDPGFRGGGLGLHGPPGPGGGPLEDVAKALGISRAKLFSQLRAGKTISQIAKARGKSLDEVKRAVTAAAKERLDAAVRRGDLTEKQAKAMLEHLEDHLDHLGSRRRFGPPPGPPGPGRLDPPPGGMPR